MGKSRQAKIKKMESSITQIFEGIGSSFMPFMALVVTISIGFLFTRQ
ncbi:hypothetical protein ISS03_02825 [Patescibacteria group bacterium]|nr:hypothetical protein [Patescibacteria group bacterium]